MREIIEKLGKIRDEILSERTEGKLRFFGLIARVDLEDKWDLLLSADWLEKSNSEKDMIYLIKKLKKEFEGNLDFLAKIVLLTPKESFMQNLVRAIARENKGEAKEIINLKISQGFTVRSLLVVTLDFAGIDLGEGEMIGKGVVATREIIDF